MKSWLRESSWRDWGSQLNSRLTFYCRLLVVKMSALGVSRQTSFPMLLTWYDWWHERCSMERTILFCCCCYFLTLVLFTWIKFRELCYMLYIYMYIYIYKSHLLCANMDFNLCKDSILYLDKKTQLFLTTSLGIYGLTKML